MRIDAVSARPDRAGKYRVHFSDGSSMGLYRQTMEDYGLYAGMELTEKEMTALRADAGKMSAKMRAVRIVAASNVSVGDLEHRLICKGEDPDDAKQAVDWMCQMDILDDRRTAEQIVQRCISKGYGIARAKQALYEKRIPKAYWEEVLTDYPEQMDAILDFLRSRLNDDPDPKAVRKAVDSLLRKGHSYQSIRSALRALSDDSLLLEED